MAHVPALIVDLALILAAAAVVTLICRRFRQPVVLGYIVAGFLVSPQAPWLPSVTEGAGLTIWAEIGVIFLLFGLGLEFSFRKLARVGAPAAIAAMVEILAMLGIGYVVGRGLGWNATDSLFLGGILSISSTTIIVKAFDELGLKGRSFVQLVFGILIVEDLVAVLLLVLLSTVATGRGFEGTALLEESLKLGFFLTLWFVGGLFLLPPLMKRIRPWLSDEMALVVSVSLCLGMVILSSKTGFSPALGAFVMGSLLAETPDGPRIEHLLRPVRDLFGAVFFVSVGMLIDLNVLRNESMTIFWVSFVTIVSKILATSFGALMAGQPLRTSVQTGFSLGQIGEFSFIIASLGLTLKVTSERLYPVAVAVSAITTLTTPFFIRASGGFASKLESTLPKPWRFSLERYAATWQRLSATREWQDFLKARALRVGTNLALATALVLVFSKVARPMLSEALGSASARWVAAAAAFALSAPFVWAMARGGLGPGRRPLESRLRALGPLAIVEMGRLIIAVAFTAFAVAEFVGRVVDAWTFLLWALFSLPLVTGHAGRTYAWFEKRFLANLGLEQSQAAAAPPPLAPWDAHVETIEVVPESTAVGRSLFELKVRERFGVTIALIERGRLRITAPGRDERLYPGDKLAVIGTDEQIESFRAFASTSKTAIGSAGSGDYRLFSVVLPADSPFLGRSIRESGLREATEGLVVGVERAGERLLNPDSSLVFEAGDLVWIVGDADRVRRTLLNEARGAR